MADEDEVTFFTVEVNIWLWVLTLEPKLVPPPPPPAPPPAAARGVRSGKPLSLLLTDPVELTSSFSLALVCCFVVVAGPIGLVIVAVAQRKCFNGMERGYV